MTIIHQDLWWGKLVPSPYTESGLGTKSKTNARCMDRCERYNAKYKIIHGLVAIPLPVYFEQLTRLKRHSRRLALRQIPTTENYYKYSFFPLSVVYWNRLSAHIVMLLTLDHWVQCGSSVSGPPHALIQQKNVLFFFFNICTCLLTLSSFGCI